MSVMLCQEPSVLSIDQRQSTAESPLLLFERTAAQIAQVFAQFKSQYGMEGADFYDDLEKQEPHIARRLEHLQAGIDTDILERYRTGRADGSDIQIWQERLFAWKELLLSALRLYEISHFGEEILCKNPAN